MGLGRHPRSFAGPIDSAPRLYSSPIHFFPILLLPACGPLPSFLVWTNAITSKLILQLLILPLGWLFQLETPVLRVNQIMPLSWWAPSNGSPWHSRFPILSMACGVPHDPSSSQATLPFTWNSPATPACYLFFPHTECGPASELFCMLFSLPTMPFLQTSRDWLSLLSLGSLLRCCLLRQPYSEFPNLIPSSVTFYPIKLLFKALIGISFNVLFSHWHIICTPQKYTFTHYHGMRPVTADTLSLLFTTISPAPRIAHVTDVP